ncbi:MAG: chemotaxis protein CheD [Candidatus Delongbacteria bacterium]|nr:chemotaxis protein CheD [Candidatus Delongbacteria bacterium]MBN2835853.1 chemotaxis protein CheD [Candidatus Delongbacteria bacterium]
MNDSIVLREYFVQPGDLCIPTEPSKIYSVCGSGVVVAIWDKRKLKGGLCHFIKPVRESKKDRSPVYALPSIIGLINSLERSGCKIETMEASVYGGSENILAKNYIKNLGVDNINAAKEILKRKKVKLVHIDTGSSRGRKIMFNTSTGESIVARVNQLREDDWYIT